MPKEPDPIKQDYELVDPTTLTEHPANPRRSDDTLIEQMIRRHGFYGTITAQRSTRHVLAGNGRLRAVRRLGLALVPVTWKDVDDDEALEILAGDNRASDLGGYDDEALLTLLTALQEGPRGLDGTGYKDDDVALLLEHLGQDGYGDVGRGMTPAERQAAFDAADVRTIVLPYPAEKYTAVVTGLGQLLKALDLQTFADVVGVLVLNALADVAAEP